MEPSLSTTFGFVYSSQNQTASPLILQIHLSDKIFPLSTGVHVTWKISKGVHVQTLVFIQWVQNFQNNCCCHCMCRLSIYTTKSGAVIVIQINNVQCPCSSLCLRAARPVMFFINFRECSLSNSTREPLSWPCGPTVGLVYIPGSPYPGVPYASMEIVRWHTIRPGMFGDMAGGNGTIWQWFGGNSAMNTDFWK